LCERLLACNDWNGVIEKGCHHLPKTLYGWMQN
jgi:hypothetical protein